MAYLYYRHKFRLPTPKARFEHAAAGHGPAPDLQRDVRGGAAHRRGLRSSTTRATCSRSRSSTTRPTRPQGIARACVERHRASGRRHRLHPPHQPAGLQGGRARERPRSPPRASSSRCSTPTSSPSPTSSGAPCHFFTDPEIGHGAGALGAPEPRLLASLTQAQAILLDGHFVIEHTARNRSGRFFNFNGTAGIWRRDRHRGRRRLAARHAHRGPRPLLPRAAEGLAVRLPARRRVAGRGPGGDERLQEPAAPLGEGLHPDRAEAPAAHPPQGEPAEGR